MGLPEIFISFQTAAVSAITRSARGVLAVALKDATEGGARIAELSQLTLTVKVQREKVQFGMDVDSKITGYAGEGTMTLKQVYTRFYEVLEQAKRGLDKRCTITTALKDPDAADGGEERYSIDNVAFTELPFMNYKMGEVNQQKLPFTFRPSDLVCLDSIRAAD